MGNGYFSQLITKRIKERKRYGYKPLDKSKLPNLEELMRLKDDIMNEKIQTTKKDETKKKN